MIRLFPVCMLAATMGCSEQPEEEGSYEGGRFERCLCDVDTSLFVQLVDEDSTLIVEFFRDHGELAGNVYLDGEIKILGHTIKGYGHNAYPLNDLILEEGELEGVVEIDKFPDVGFSGTFSDERQTLTVDVNHLGNGDLWRVDDATSP